MSNFVFPRRSLQRLIDRLAGIIDHAKISSIVSRLNRLDDARLPAMWELVMLDALAGAGVLRHEIALVNGRRPDIELTVVPVDGVPFVIIGDVACVSDVGLDEQNPVETLSDELNRLVKKAGLNPNHFGYDVRGDIDGPYQDGRMKLFLPNKGKLLALMPRVVSPWLQRVKVALHEATRFEYSDAEATFVLTYDPTQQYAQGRYLSYEVAASRDKNPLYRALKGKVSQLKQAPATALRLIIACDGDCALMRQSSLMRAPGTFTAREVAEDFLRKNSSIDAVLLVTIDEQRGVSAVRTIYRMKYDLVIARPEARSSRMTPASIAALDAAMRRAVQRVPEPVLAAYNAARRCREQHFGRDMLGGYEMDGEGNVSISARGLQRLLAGEMSISDFLAEHGWNNECGRSNPFANAIKHGKLISKVEVASVDQNDDNWLTFSFGPPDPAISPFRVTSAE